MLRGDHPAQADPRTARHAAPPPPPPCPCPSSLCFFSALRLCSARSLTLSSPPALSLRHAVLHHPPVQDEVLQVRHVQVPLVLHAQDHRMRHTVLPLHVRCARAEWTHTRDTRETHARHTRDTRDTHAPHTPARHCTHTYTHPLLAHSTQPPTARASRSVCVCVCVRVCAYAACCPGCCCTPGCQPNTISPEKKVSKGEGGAPDMVTMDRNA